MCFIHDRSRGVMPSTADCRKIQTATCWSSSIASMPISVDDVCIVMCTYRSATKGDPQRVWGDLRVALWSIDAYVDESITVHVAWDGPVKPDNVPQHPRFNYVERPKGKTLATAMNWLIAQTATPYFVIIPDDVCLHPDAWDMLLEDYDAVKQLDGTNIGIMGTRSNYVVGPQNIRAGNGGALAPNSLQWDNEDVVFPVETVFPVVAIFDRQAYELVGRFPDQLHWFGDNLYSYDLAQRGYDRWVSRAYVHHVGSRGTKSDTGATDQQLAAEGLLWLKNNRPDFYAYLNR